MKGKLCFVAISLILAITIGNTSNSSAYAYQGTVAEGKKDTAELVVSAGMDLFLEGEVDVSSVQEAKTSADERLAEIEELKLQEEAAAKAFPCTEEERLILGKIVMAEAGAEDIIGQILVTNVILNRVKAGWGTISEVVFAPGQFSPVQLGSYWSSYPDESVEEAVDRALAGEDYSEGAIYFISTEIDGSFFWSNFEFVQQYDGHLFFK